MSASPPPSAELGWRCAWCGCSSTPQRRRGPGGSGTLCNACGLHHAKDEHRRRPRPVDPRLTVDFLLNGLPEGSLPLKKKKRRENPARKQADGLLALLQCTIGGW